MAERIRRPVWFFVVLVVAFGGLIGIAVFAPDRQVKWSEVWILLVVFVGFMSVLGLGWWATQNIPSDDPEEE